MSTLSMETKRKENVQCKNLLELMTKLVQKQEELGKIRWSDNISSYSARSSEDFFSEFSKITLFSKNPINRTYEYSRMSCELNPLIRC